MDKEMHFGPKDFDVQWFSGTGKGGQHRNKHQNCCRIIHKETGISAVGTSSKERIANRRAAFTVLASRLISFFSQEEKERYRVKQQTIRNYHAVRNDVHDKASGLHMTYTDVVGKGNLGPMIEARKRAVQVGLIDG